MAASAVAALPIWCAPGNAGSGRSRRRTAPIFEVPALALGMCSIVLSRRHRFRAELLDDLPHRPGQRRAAEHRRPPGAEDPGLLTPDLFDRIAQPVDMIESYRTDHAHVRIHDVGGVESPAETDLEYRHVHGRAREDVECRQRVVFEEGQRRGAARRLDAFERGDQAGVVGLHAIDADAFVVAHQVWRGETPGALARGAQQRVEEGDRGALAVGAGNRHHAIGGRQQFEPLRHRAHP